MLGTLRGKLRWGIAVAGVGWLCLAGAGLRGLERQAFSTRLQPERQGATTPAHPRALVDQYCVRCHNTRQRAAGLTLDTLDVGAVGGDAEVWETVLRKIRAGEMPPPSIPRPGQSTLDEFAAWLEASLDHAAATDPDPGRVPVHRLNRTEYANAIRDLLALDIDRRSILIDEDPGESGFDNTAAALSMSPLLVERYLSAARRISRLAVGDPTLVPVFDTYTVPKMLGQDDRVSEDLPFASRGGVAIRHRFPLDGDYVIKIRLQSQLYQYILGLGRPHPLEVRLDGVRVTRFTVGGDAPGRPAPDSFAGDIDGDPAWEEYMHFADASLEARFQARAGTRVVGVSFAEYTPEPEGVLQPAQTGASGDTYNQMYYDNPRIETVSIGGPYEITGPGETPSRRRILVCRPETTADEPGCAAMVLSRLARRAYRRPVTEEDVETLLGFYRAGRRRAGFEAGIRSGLTRILIDPEFLVRIERDPIDATPGAVYRVDDLALASRLSFFLWSSIPDDELLDLATREKLREPLVLVHQVRRMLADPRAKALTDNFASQWLNLPKLAGATPDPDEFPDFDEDLRRAFAQETKLFLDDQIRADRSVLDLLRANHTFVNERLARHYQISHVYGNGFRRVTFTEDEARGGLLGQGSILTVTSYANRTSPVLRGKWVLENLLATPPPPPPPNVESLAENGTGETPASMRDRMLQHRTNASCAVCHTRLDPLGFALENFDAVGKWRTTHADGTPVDASDVLPDGTQLDGVRGLRTYLLSQRERFVGALTEKLLTYALGRSVEASDLPAIRKITRDAAAKDNRWSSIIEGIVNSVPFRMSIVRDTPDATTTPRREPTGHSGRSEVRRRR